MIEFLADEHIYLVDGVITPSVSEVLKVRFSSDYSSVPDYILSEKARFGSKVHKLIENEITEDDNIYVQNCLTQWVKLKEKHNISIISKEQIVSSKLGYCGTFDAIAMIDNSLCIIDYKTTLQIYEDKWSWQLSLYKRAYEEMTDKTIDKLYIVHLEKKSLGKLIEVKSRTDEEIEDLINEYQKIHANKP